MTFRLTARDGEGGVGHDTKVLQVDGAAGPFQVTAPRVGDRWAAGERATVEWDVAGTDAGPVASGEVEILLSADDGEIFDEILNPHPTTASKRSRFRRPRAPTRG